ncbi:MAG: hypothetical protein KatS3mg115_0303 [Candidatus Poribacteria bacterium]|nr:MAG: hypothetical protein KatS3mg115_0303 [Candidatus Poribacteria bacterium]
MTVPDYGSTPQVGKRRALHLLRSMSPEERRRLLRTIGQQNPQLRAALEEELVLFEDLVLLSDDELAQLVLRVWRHDPNLWAIALRQSSQALRNKVFRTMSASMRDRTGVPIGDDATSSPL